LLQLQLLLQLHLLQLHLLQFLLLLLASSLSSSAFIFPPPSPHPPPQEQQPAPPQQQVQPPGEAQQPPEVSPRTNLMSSYEQDEMNGTTPTSQNDQSMVTSSNSNNSLQPADNPTFVDITPYLNLPQTEAAKKLGLPTSTLSKRWREAVRNRKWPFRVVNKLDKEITTLLHNIPQGPGSIIPDDVQEALAILLRKRQDELRPVIIRV